MTLRFASGFRLASLSVVALSLGVASAAAQQRSWLDPKLLEAAKKEGNLIVYSSMNEQEGLPLFKIFTDATGIKVQYVRAADSALMGRMAIEFRTKQKAWDIVQTTTINKVTPALMAQIDPTEAKDIAPEARATERVRQCRRSRRAGIFSRACPILPPYVRSRARSCLIRPRRVARSILQIWLDQIVVHLGGRRLEGRLHVIFRIA